MCAELLKASEELRKAIKDLSRAERNKNAWNQLAQTSTAKRKLQCKK